MKGTTAKEKCYIVMWAIEIWAATPRQAAELALAIQRDPASTATVFDVYSGKSGRHTRHDVKETTNTKKARKQ